MRGSSAWRRSEEGGFTLVELLAVIGIVAIIAFPLTEAFILGLKTTDANANNMSRAVAVQALQSFFTGDVQSTDVVATAASTCAPPPSDTSAEVFLHLSWTDGVQRDVTYFRQADGVEGERELVRWSCTGGSTADKRMLGRITYDPAGPAPVVAMCQPGPCPTSIDRLVPTPVRTITLRVLTPDPIELAVTRRAT